MVEGISGIIIAAWDILLDSSPFVLFGFLAAGVIKAYIPDDAVSRHLGEKSAGAVIKASLLGIPLPLCSCSVLPTAIGLRKQGAHKGASAAFLVSTPESGVDSIAITWALLDPVMTVARPIAAFITATITGLAINALPDDESEQDRNDSAGVDGEMEEESGCGCSASGCSTDQVDRERGGGAISRLREGIVYAFNDLLSEIGGWLLIGLVIAGVITWLVPVDLFTGRIGGEIVSLLLMLIVGIPLYICATASTPIAAALVLKGLSPGAALVFLLAGPATNAATLTVVLKHWGRKATVAYLISIGLCSLILGWLLNRIYAAAGLDITRWVQVDAVQEGSIFAILCSIVLLALIVRVLLQKRSGSGGPQKTC
ncbi:SO_0444 family Cu/Zn efflux transporter [Candidatus Zixiibacteriota bacterium]